MSGLCWWQCPAMQLRGVSRDMKPECDSSVCAGLQDGRGGGQRGHCTTFLTPAFLSADITAALNTAAQTRSPRPCCPLRGGRAPAIPHASLRDTALLLCEEMSHLPSDDFSVRSRWKILKRNEASFGFFIFAVLSESSVPLDFSFLLLSQNPRSHLWGNPISWQDFLGPEYGGLFPPFFFFFFPPAP